MTATIPINVVHLLPVLDAKLIQLLRSLTPEDWQAQTIAKRWKVKDVVAHLLDGNMRVLSIFRDQYFGEQPQSNSYTGLVDFLNRLNADWVQAMKRISPELLILLHESTGRIFCDYLASLDPFGKSVFVVDWAGEKESKNWMEIARQYTEKWLHQQQIREAINKPGLMSRELFYPFIDIFMMALPHTYRSISSPRGTTVKLTITGDTGGSWYLVRSNDEWILSKTGVTGCNSEILISPEVSWKLFSKSLRPEQIKDQVEIRGDHLLGARALEMVSVMA